MTYEKANTQSEGLRLSVADGLRGFAIIAITLLHSINHFNLYIPTENSTPFFQWSDSMIETIVTSVSSGKSYGLFALLFGFTFYLQLTNQEKKGGDFNHRFIWRMFLLFIIGTINSAFFAGEILVLYSIVGLILVPLRHLGNRRLLIIAALFLSQPIILAKIVYILNVPSYSQNFQRYAAGPLFSKLADSSLLETIQTNLTLGKEVYWLSIISNCERIFQAICFFILGMVFGRKKLFELSPVSKKFWKWTMFATFIAFAVLKFTRTELVTLMTTGALRNMIDNLLSLWSDFSIVLFMVGLFIFIYTYPTKKMVSWMEPFGKMSLTNYVTQSVLGSFLFYGYGLSMSKYCGITLSFGIGIFMLVLQYCFCIWWLKDHPKGPIEQLWHNLTWIKKPIDLRKHKE